MKLYKRLFITVLSFLTGLFILHPLMMLFGHFMHATYLNESHVEKRLILQLFFNSFSTEMMPWGILISILSGIIGYYFISIQFQKELLKIANGTKDRFFSIIAHDLKAPFFPLIGYSRLLLNQYEDLDDEKRKEYIKIIQNSAEQTEKLLENLLAWSKFQTGKLQFFPCKTDIAELVDEIMLMFRKNAASKKISLLSTIKKGQSVVVDRNMISSVFRNLLANAVKYTNEGGFIKISSITTDKHEIISVSDTGIGMTPDELMQLFRLDVISSKPGTSQEKGSGLGLMLCQEFVKCHKGQLLVKSELGKGSCFSLQLPKN